MYNIDYDELMEFLASKNPSERVKVGPMWSESCPIARFVTWREGVRTSVGPDNIHIYSVIPTNHLLPEWVMRFIGRVDRHDKDWYDITFGDVVEILNGMYAEVKVKNG